MPIVHPSSAPVGIPSLSVKLDNGTGAYSYDVTPYVRLVDGISMTRGRQDERATVEASTLSLTLDNSDGRFISGLNMHPNPSLEVDTSNWASNTVLGTFTSCTSFVRTTVRAFDQFASGLATWPASATGSTMGSFVSGHVLGKTYTASAYVWVPTGSPAVRINCIFNGSPGSLSLTHDAWERVTVTYTATATTHFIAIVCPAVLAGGETCYIDAVQVEASPVATAYAPPVYVDMPIRVSHTVDGNTTDRFTGYVQQWPVMWPDGGETYSTVTITATDMLARLARDDFSSVPVEAVSALGPVAYWPLTEPDPYTSGANVTATAQPDSKLFSSGNAPTGKFGQTAASPNDPATSVLLSGTSQLQAAPVQGLSTTGWTWAGVFNSSAGGFTFTLANQTASPANESLKINVSTSNVVVTSANYDVESGPGPTATASYSSAYTDAAPHDLIVTCGAANTIRVYLDGVEVTPGTANIGGHPVQGPFILWNASAPTTSTLAVGHVSGYARVLSAAEIASLHQGLLADFGDTADARLTRFALWAGKTIVAEPSTMLAPHLDTTGLSPLDAMQQVAAADDGVLFVDGSGVLTFQSRHHRLNSASKAPVPASAIAWDVAPVQDMQHVVNYATGQRPGGAELAPVFDQTSINTHGKYPSSFTLLVSSDVEIQAWLDWTIFTSSRPRARVPSLTVDCLTMPAASAATMAGLKLSDRISLTGMPFQSPTGVGDLIVEGINETVSASAWTLALNVSPGTYAYGWVLDDPVWSVLDSTTDLVY